MAEKMRFATRNDVEFHYDVSKSRWIPDVKDYSRLPAYLYSPENRHSAIRKLTCVIRGHDRHWDILYATGVDWCRRCELVFDVVVGHDGA